YVGKAYFETGHGSDIGIVENSEELTKEAVRLQSLTAFWKAFEKHAKSQKCDIAKYTSLSEDELVLTEGRVSWITWLIEPERGNSDFKRWTGTMETKTHQDKAGTTINAFEHFAYVYSRKQMVFADLQSSESWDPENRAPVLFDVMTHSIKSDSGVGDFGPEGIEKWVQGHTCVQRCQQLSLPALDADIDSDPEEDEG
ncbi:kinase-like domain-containing protein, partial [Mycena floridula]